MAHILTPVDTSRRLFCKRAAGLLVGAALPLRPAEASFWHQPRKLWLRRAETGERCAGVFWENDHLNVRGYVDACRILRDVREDKVVQIDVQLLNLLRGVTGYLEQLGLDPTITVHSGYRTKATNTSLKYLGAADNSMHLYGKAADVSVPGVSPEIIARLGLYFGVGGVGSYPERGIVHLDTGTKRYFQKRDLPTKSRKKQ